MILALLAYVAFQDTPPEPATRGELDAVLTDYRAAKFDVDRSDIAKDYRRDWLKSHPK